MDTYTGDVLFSDGDSQSIRRLDRMTGEVSTVVQLTDPTQLLGVLRSGVSGAEGFHLFVAEPTIGQVTRVVPELGLASLYAAAPGIQDVAFLPVGQISGSEALLAAEQVGAGGQVAQILVPLIYQMEAFNPPDLPPCLVTVEIPDPNLEGAVRQALGLSQMEPITCDAAESLKLLPAEQLGISRLDGLEGFVNLQFLFLFGNEQIRDVAPLAGLTDLLVLNLDGNQISDISPLVGLTSLQILALMGNQISDVSPLSGMTSSPTPFPERKPDQRHFRSGWNDGPRSSASPA